MEKYNIIQRLECRKPRYFPALMNIKIICR
jgi:hypothetical protein